MNEQTFALILLTFSVLSIAYATLGRAFGFHRPIPWSSGGTSTLTGELSFAGFAGCLGLFVAVSPIFLIPGLICWLIGSRSQSNAGRKFAQEEQMLRETNAMNHPGIFDVDPPEYLDPNVNELVDVYDCGACVYLGRIASSAIVELIDATAGMPGQGPNDIFVIEETLEPPLMKEENELKAFLQPHFDARGHAILRWFPANESK